VTSFLASCKGLSPRLASDPNIPHQGISPKEMIKVHMDICSEPLFFHTRLVPMYLQQLQPLKRIDSWGRMPDSCQGLNKQFLITEWLQIGLPEKSFEQRVPRVKVWNSLMLRFVNNMGYKLLFQIQYSLKTINIIQEPEAGGFRYVA
jgi:hypothetical protein